MGGGNSAGQAALYLAQQGSQVTIAIRRDDLAATMSRYLIDRIEADRRIELLTTTEVRALAGDDHLAQVTLEHTPDRRAPDDGLRRAVLLHRGRAGHRLARAARWRWTGPGSSSPTGPSIPSWPRPRCSPAATRCPSRPRCPGVFAVGDVRQGSLKRVAAAVGEGSSAVRSVHEVLAATA